jgi:hypothetical protein
MRWCDQLAIAHHEIFVIALLVADILDQRAAKEADFSRLALALMRLRALLEYRNDSA